MNVRGRFFSLVPIFRGERIECKQLEGRTDISETSISVVTVTKDNFDDLNLTANSISRQTHKANNVVVIDSSQPANAARVRKLCQALGFKYLWEQPRGVYSAMNLGLHSIDNEGWVQFLNSGDFFSSPRAIEQAEAALVEARRLGAKWALGSILLVDEPRGKIEVSTFRPGYWPMRLGLTWFPHPSTFYDVGAIREMGGFSEVSQIAADYYAALLMFRQYGQPHEISAVIATHYLDGISNVHPVLGAVEGAKARIEVFGPLQILIELFAQMPLFLLRKIGRHTRSIGFGVGNPLSTQFEWEPEIHFCGEERKTKNPPRCCAEFLARIQED